MYCTSRNILFTLLLLSTLVVVRSQDNTTVYWQPDVSINYKVSPLYAHNFSVTNRNYIYKDQITKLSTRQIDLSHFSNVKLDFNKSLGFGMQYRFRENFEENRENELRFTQQFNVTHKIKSARLGNRFRSEQRISPSTTIQRLRYRLALDFPLMGLNLDVGEPYLVTTTEALLSIGKAMTPTYDQRFTTQIGWSLPKGVKLQVGVQYRLENYTQNTEQVIFFLNSLVLSL